MSEKNERDAFETWFSTTEMGPRRSIGDQVANACWITWQQARAALSAGEAQQGLTDAEIAELWKTHYYRSTDTDPNRCINAFARAIEARAALTPPRQMVADRSAIYDAMVQFCDGNGVGIEPEVVDELAGAVERFLQARANDAATGMVADSAQAEPDETARMVRTLNSKPTPAVGKQYERWSSPSFDRACSLAEKIIEDYKRHYDFPEQGESHMHDCIVSVLNGAAPVPGASPAALTSNDDLADLVSKAMSRAWSLGQTYWQQADSEYASQNRKSEATQAKFQALIDETRTAILAANHGRRAGAPHPSTGEER